MFTSLMKGGEAEYNQVNMIRLNATQFHKELMENYYTFIQEIDSSKPHDEPTITIFTLSEHGFILQAKDHNP